MKKLVLVLLLLLVNFTVLNAGMSRGHKEFYKKFNQQCKNDFTGKVEGKLDGYPVFYYSIAYQHTIAEWESIGDGDDLKQELKKLCPSVKDKYLRSKYLRKYYDFLLEYASDSGNRTSI